ncbi:MAG: hypothetical protein MHM6MM_003454 [Cercozoa sp. M6MM]
MPPMSYDDVWFRRPRRFRPPFVDQLERVLHLPIGPTGSTELRDVRFDTRGEMLLMLQAAQRVVFVDLLTRTISAVASPEVGASNSDKSEGGEILRIAAGSSRVLLLRRENSAQESAVAMIDLFDALPACRYSLQLCDLVHETNSSSDSSVVAEQGSYEGPLYPSVSSAPLCSPLSLSTSPMQTSPRSESDDKSTVPMMQFRQRARCILPSGLAQKLFETTNERENESEATCEIELSMQQRFALLRRGATLALARLDEETHVNTEEATDGNSILQIDLSSHGTLFAAAFAPTPRWHDERESVHLLCATNRALLSCCVSSSVMEVTSIRVLHTLPSSAERVVFAAPATFAWIDSDGDVCTRSVFDVFLCHLHSDKAQLSTPNQRQTLTCTVDAKMRHKMRRLFFSQAQLQSHQMHLVALPDATGVLVVRTAVHEGIHIRADMWSLNTRCAKRCRADLTIGSLPTTVDSVVRFHPTSALLALALRGVCPQGVKLALLHRRSSPERLFVPYFDELSDNHVYDEPADEFDAKDERSQETVEAESVDIFSDSTQEDLVRLLQECDDVQVWQRVTLPPTPNDSLRKAIPVRLHATGVIRDEKAAERRRRRLLRKQRLAQQHREIFEKASAEAVAATSVSSVDRPEQATPLQSKLEQDAKRRRVTPVESAAVSVSQSTSSGSVASAQSLPVAVQMMHDSTSTNG